MTDNNQSINQDTVLTVWCIVVRVYHLRVSGASPWVQPSPPSYRSCSFMFQPSTDRQLTQFIISIILNFLPHPVFLINIILQLFYCPDTRYNTQPYIDGPG